MTKSQVANISFLNLKMKKSVKNFESMSVFLFVNRKFKQMTN